MHDKLPIEPIDNDIDSEKITKPFKYISLIKRLHVEY